MRAAVLVDVGRIEVREVPRTPPGPRDVVLRVAAVGLCGTDVHLFLGHGNYNFDERGRPVPLAVQPQILGHEIVGVVEEVGREVRDPSASSGQRLRPGDRVIVDQGRSCVSVGRSPACEYCATGDSHQCEHYGEHGITGLPGGFAEFFTIPAPNAVRVESALAAEELALTEPLGCVVHATDLLARTPARYTLPDRAGGGGGGGGGGRPVRCALVCGAGPAGLLFIQYLRNVVGFDGLLLAVEPNARKRALAERFGAETIDPSAEDLVAAVRERTAGRRAELLVEATGSGPLFATIPGLLRKQGTALLYGHGHHGVDLGVLNQVMFLEPTLVSPIGASGGHEPDGRPSTYLRALRLIERGTIDVASLITHRYPSLDAVPAALAGDYRAPDYVKGVVILEGAPS